MAWTKEARELARTRALERNQAQRDNREVFAAQNRNKVAEESQTFSQEGGTARVTSRGPGMVRLFKPGRYGYDPVIVPVSNLETVLAAGYVPDCPNCGKRTCQENGEPCTGVEPRQYRVCPIPSCGRRFYDLPPTTEVVIEEDPNLIADDAYLPSTPGLRTKGMLDAHLAVYHPTEAAAMARQNPVHLRRLEEESART